MENMHLNDALVGMRPFVRHQQAEMYSVTLQALI